MLNVLGNTGYNEIVIRAAFPLTFAAFLPVGEFTSDQLALELGAAFGKWFLTKRSISLAKGGEHMEINLPAPKIDPFRHGIQLIIASSNDASCHVTAMKQLIRIDTHRPPHAPLFCIGKRKEQPFTRD